MKRALLLALAACGSSAPRSPDAPLASDAPAQARWVAYVGGYGGAITWYSVDPATGAFEKLGEVAASTPSFLAFATGHVYAVDETGNRVSAYAMASDGGLTHVDDVYAGGTGPAYLGVADGNVVAANYGDGSVAVFPIEADGSVGAASQVVNAGSHAHEVVIAGGHAYVPCLGSDYVAEYAWAQGHLSAAGQLMTASGAGPRHLAFAGDGFAYLVDETASTVMALAVNAQGQLSALQTISTLPTGFTGSNTGAEIAVAGSHVYASNRGADDLAVFSRDASGQLSPVAHVPTAGMTPRHFSLSPDGHWLFVANQASSSVVPFAIGADGIPVAVGTSVTVQMPSFVGIVAFP